MPDPQPNDPELSPADLELERALSSLRPAQSAVDARVAMFDAGYEVGRAAGDRAARRSVARAVVGWRSAAAVLAVGAAVSIAANVRLVSAEKTVAQMPATQPVATPASAGEDRPADDLGPIAGGLQDRTAPAQGDLLALRTMVLSDGIDALPRSVFGSNAAPLRLRDVGGTP